MSAVGKDTCVPDNYARTSKLFSILNSYNTTNTSRLSRSIHLLLPSRKPNYLPSIKDYAQNGVLAAYQANVSPISSIENIDCMSNQFKNITSQLTNALKYNSGAKCAYRFAATYVLPLPLHIFPYLN